MVYDNPGKRFIEQFGQVGSAQEVMRYVEYLRSEAGLPTAPPIDLARIYARFGIPLPKRQPLPDLQGLLVDPEKGIILVNAQDRPSRQRFTEAHELMEMLFSCLKSGDRGLGSQTSGVFRPHVKEGLCNEGAAELLMPRTSFGSHLRELGVSYDTARTLAALYEVSITASMIQMVRIGSGCHAVVLWRMKNKPTEMRNAAPANQLCLFDTGTPVRPLPKLRVEWAFRGPSSPYIPKEKSVPDDSSIYRAYEHGIFVEEDDHLNLGGTIGTFRCENQPFEADDERFVLSLLHMPGDRGCRP